MFARLARFVSGHWVVVLAAWAVVGVALTLAGPDWEQLARDGDTENLPSQMPSARGARLLKAAFPNRRWKSQLVLVVARPGGALGEADDRIADRLVQRLAPWEGAEGLIRAVWSHETPLIGHELTSPVGEFGQATMIVAQLSTELAAVPNMAMVAGIRRMLDEVRHGEDYPPGLELGLTGSAGIGADMLLAAQESIRHTEWTTIALVVLILLGVYRAPGLVIVPLLAIGASWVVSINLLGLLALWSRQTGWFDFAVFRTSKVFIVVMLFGAATDYCLFLISRYVEELRRGQGAAEALQSAVARVGPALTASAMTVILGLGTMSFAQFGRFRSGGLSIALALLAAWVACLTLAPALLRAARQAAFWPFAAPAADAPGGGPARAFFDRLWNAIARAIVRRPGWIFGGCLLIMAWPAYAGLWVPVTFDLLSELSPHRFSIRGTDLLTRYFPKGEIGPLGILARRSTPVFQTGEGKAAISRLTRELYQFDDHESDGRPGVITNVRSLTSPLGEKPGVLNPFTSLGRSNMVAREKPEIVFNIYLMSRVVEEQKRRGAVEGLRCALVSTGGVITSCGIIMAGTFASMLTGSLWEMYELGFALSFGVLLDTFVIRTILVPSFLVLWNGRIARRPAHG